MSSNAMRSYLRYAQRVGEKMLRVAAMSRLCADAADVDMLCSRCALAAHDMRGTFDCCERVFTARRCCCHVALSHARAWRLRRYGAFMFTAQPRRECRGCAARTAMFARHMRAL